MSIKTKPFILDKIKICKEIRDELDEVRRAIADHKQEISDLKFHYEIMKDNFDEIYASLSERDQRQVLKE